MIVWWWLISRNIISFTWYAMPIKCYQTKIHVVENYFHLLYECGIQESLSRSSILFSLSFGRECKNYNWEGERESVRSSVSGVDRILHTVWLFICRKSGGEAGHPGGAWGWRCPRWDSETRSDWVSLGRPRSLSWFSARGAGIEHNEGKRPKPPFWN